MYQHPSNKNTWKEYRPNAAQELEAAWQKYKNEHGPHLVELTVAEDTPVVVSLRSPMTQCSPKHDIRRRVRRLIEP